MKKIPLSKLAPTFVLFGITLLDVAVAVRDFVTQNTGTGIIILVMGIFLGYTSVKTLIRNIKEYK